MPMAASNIAVVVVTITINVSFCLIGMSRKARMVNIYFSTALATLKSLELSLSPVFSAADWRMSKRTRRFSMTKAIIPPLWIKDSPSPTVRTPGPKAGRILGSSFSGPLTNSTWHDCGGGGRFILWEVTLRPLTISPATTLSRALPKGSSPRMQIEIGESAALKAAAGHSMNLVKFNRNTAFTSYSRDSSAARQENGVAAAISATRIGSAKGAARTTIRFGNCFALHSVLREFLQELRSNRNRFSRNGTTEPVAAELPPIPDVADRRSGPV